MVAHPRKGLDQVSEDPSQPALIAQGVRQAFGLAKRVELLREVTQGLERTAQVQAKIDGLFDGLATLREMLHRTERLFEPPHGLAVGRAIDGFGPCLVEVLDSVLPSLAPHGVMS